jgi:acyl-CoA reductase-like NAD-dependent aldehyde dehydrogenase
MPFGGRKASGIGMGGILPSMVEMTEEKMLVFRSKLI